MVHRICTEEVVPLDALVPGIQDCAVEWTARCLEKDREKRIPNASNLADVLAAGEGTQQPRVLGDVGHHAKLHLRIISRH